MGLSLPKSHESDNASICDSGTVAHLSVEEAYKDLCSLTNCEDNYTQLGPNKFN